jgi:DNA-binding IscR family transcriptional regulator
VGDILDNIADDCCFHDRCVMRGVWQQINDATAAILEETNFEVLAQREREARA